MVSDGRASSGLGGAEPLAGFISRLPTQLTLTSVHCSDDDTYTMARSVAACVTVLLALFEIGSCIKCYHCNSENDRTCGDPFTLGNKQLTDCATQDSTNYNRQFLYSVLPPEVFGSVQGAPRYCHKIVMETGTVIRTCLDANPTEMNNSCRVMDRLSKSTSPEKRIKYCNVCDKDGCNGAASLFVSLPLAIMAVALVFFNLH